MADLTSISNTTWSLNTDINKPYHTASISWKLLGNLFLEDNWEIGKLLIYDDILNRIFILIQVIYIIKCLPVDTWLNNILNRELCCH